MIVTYSLVKRSIPNTIKIQSGIGLIEIMISMLIGLFIMAGVLQMFGTTSQNAVATAGSSRIQESIRYAFARIEQDLTQTGNLGCISGTVDQDIDNDPNKSRLTKNMLGLSAGANELYDFATIVTGVENADNTTAPANTIAAGTDTFRVRFANNSDRIAITASDPASVTVDDATALSPNQVVLASNCSRGAIFMITGIVGNVVSHAVNAMPDAGDQFNATSEREVDFNAGDDSLPYLYASRTGAYQYFIGTSAAATAAGQTCDINNDQQNCALFVRDSGENLELAEGVHDMQIDYGWNTDTDQLFFTNAAGVVNWSDVDRVRITLDFNSIDNAIASGNTLDTLITKSVTRIFNLPNQLQ